MNRPKHHLNIFRYTSLYTNLGAEKDCLGSVHQAVLAEFIPVKLFILLILLVLLKSNSIFRTWKYTNMKVLI